jgi:hypothetical protein
LAQQHKAFFRSPVRNTKLKELQRPNDNEAAVRMKMLAVLAKQPADIDKLLLHAFGQLDPAHFDADDLLPHARVFLSIWKDSLSARLAFEQWSDDLAGMLRVEDQLNDAPDTYDPDDDDSDEQIERFVLSRLLQSFQGDTSADGLSPCLS